VKDQHRILFNLEVQRLRIDTVTHPRSLGPKLTVMDLLHLFVYSQTNSGNLPGLPLQYSYFRCNSANLLD
jgi:hypothetical protein